MLDKVYEISAKNSGWKEFREEIRKGVEFNYDNMPIEQRNKITNSKPIIMQKITPFLWFDSQAEEAAQLYLSLFKNSSIKNVTRYNEESSKAAGRPAGSKLTSVLARAIQLFWFWPAVSGAHRSPLRVIATRPAVRGTDSYRFVKGDQR